MPDEPAQLGVQVVGLAAELDQGVLLGVPPQADPPVPAIPAPR